VEFPRALPQDYCRIQAPFAMECPNAILHNLYQNISGQDPCRIWEGAASPYGTPREGISVVVALPGEPGAWLGEKSWSARSARNDCTR